MKLIIYKIDDGFVEYLDDKGKEFRSSLAFIIESQMIEYFDNDDRLKLCELYKDKYNSELVVETALWG
ncbi:VUT family protein, partial [Vibrio parahaemolyticus]|nr:VUT family protein [Vibrio parahaemolyticus]